MHMYFWIMRCPGSVYISQSRSKFKIILAQNPKFFAEEEVNAMASHCQPCTDMVNDVVLIAQNDKNHFDQIWTALR